MLSKIGKVFIALLGVAALLLLGVALMPARAIKLATDRIDGLAFGTTEGRLVSGEADFAYRGQNLGRVAWSLKPGTLLDLELGTAWRIAHRDYTVTGTAAAGAGTARFAATGIINAFAVNRFLSQYHISLDGVFEVDGLDVRLDHGEITAEGRLRWSGGRTVYRLSGETHDVELPGMVGILGSAAGEPVLEVVTAKDSLRLLGVRLDPGGWVHIGVTERLTSLAGNPWPGGNTGDAVVVTVSERLFERGGGNVPYSEG